MGTRNLICVVKEGDYKVAQYGQWDGYPTGVGSQICEFLMEADLDAFREGLDGVTLLTEEEVTARWKECGADDSGWVTMDIADKLREKYPALSRETGADVLGLICAGEVTEVQESLSFAADSLFCEWAYVVNMDTEMLEIFKGFNKEPLPEGARFADLSTEDAEYQPVRHILDLPFNLCVPQNMRVIEQVIGEEGEIEMSVLALDSDQQAVLTG